MSSAGRTRLIPICVLWILGMAAACSGIAAGAASPALAQDGQALGSDDFEFYATVSTPGGEEIKRDSLYMVPLPGEILRHTSSDLRDLRLLDGYGRTETETPFIVLTRSPLPNQAPMALSLVSQEQDQDMHTLVLEKPGDIISLGSQTAALKFDLPDQDIFALVHVWGSYDKVEWVSLATGALFNFPSTSLMRRDEVPLTRSQHSFFKVELRFQETVPPELASTALRFTDLAPLAEDRILFAPDLTSISALPADPDATPLDHYSFSSFDQQQREDETVLLVEARLPAQQLRLVTATPYFTRDVDVYVADIPDPEAFILAAQGTVYRFPMSGGGQVATTLDVNTGKHRYFRIHIHNHGAQPLEITEVVFTWQQRMLFFTALSDRADYALWFQSLADWDSLTPPGYDLSGQVNQENWRSREFTVLSAEDAERNLKVQALEFQRDAHERGLFNWIVAGLCIAVIIWLFWLLKRTHGNREAS